MTMQLRRTARKNRIFMSAAWVSPASWAVWASWAAWGLLAAVAAPGTAGANDIAVANVRLVDKNTADKDWNIRFDIGWENSWRSAGAPSPTANWDAAWVFAKWSKKTGAAWSDWAHCTLLSTGAVTPGGAQIDFGQTNAVNVGAFIYRNSPGAGSNAWTDAELRWDYGADGVADGDAVRVKLFALEMVYVSSGPFYLGTPDNSATSGFYEGDSGTPRGPYYVEHENQIAVADTSGSLYYNQDNTAAGDQAGPIPAAFPKGVNPFYLMKYEVSQKEYADFLNTLNASQQPNRVDAELNFNQNRNFLKKTAGSPAFFGADANNNAGAATAADKNKLNEPDDGQWVACNYLSWMDAVAFADWAGLRPFTELEFEKAARGPALPVVDEYAWGNAVLESLTTSLANAGTKSETPNRGNVNITGTSPSGPYRSGGYALAGSTRQKAGAGFYGAMDLSGNLWERTVTVGNATVRAFQGTHGNGALSASGHATNADWPGHSGGQVTGAGGAGLRGGTWNNTATNARPADRNNAANTNTNRNNNYGGRFAKTPPKGHRPARGRTNSDQSPCRPPLTYEHVISRANLYRAAQRAALGKRLKKTVADFFFHLEAEIGRLHDELKSKTYRPGEYREFDIYEPKKRRIAAAPFRDRVVHHAVHDVIEPAFDATWSPCSYACRVGMGTHRAVARAQELSRCHSFYLHGDIKRFFPSVDQSRLKEILKSRLEDNELLELLCLIIDSAPIGSPGLGKGLPIGNVTSQLFANLYLHELDRFITDEGMAGAYIRYMDDFLLFSSSSLELVRFKDAIGDFLIRQLHLRLHDGKTRISKTSKGLPFLGFVLMERRRRLASSSVRRFRKRMKRQVGLFKTGAMDAPSVLRSLQSWTAHSRHANTIRLRAQLWRDVCATSPPLGKITEPYFTRR